MVDTCGIQNILHAKYNINLIRFDLYDRQAFKLKPYFNLTFSLARSDATARYRASKMSDIVLSKACRTYDRQMSVILLFNLSS